MPGPIHNTLDLEPRLERGGLIYAALPIGLVVYAAGMLAIPMLQTEEQIALALLLLLPALLIGVYIVTKAIFGDRLAGTIIAVTCLFISAANFRARAYTDKSIDWQVGIKLVALGLLLVMAAVFLSYAFNRLHLGRLFYVWLLFFVWLIVSSVYAEAAVFALTCSISFLICYFYAVYMTVWLSRTRTVEIMMLVAFLMCVGSIFVYFAVPSMGRMQAWTDGATFGDTGRMKGLTGSANAIGIISALSIVLSVLYYRSFGPFGRRLAIVLVPSALACLILSNNRGSMAAIAVAIWFAFVCRSATGFKLILSIAGGVIGAALLVIFPMRFSRCCHGQGGLTRSPVRPAAHRSGLSFSNCGLNGHCLDTGTRRPYRFFHQTRDCSTWPPTPITCSWNCSSQAASSCWDYFCMRRTERSC